MKKKHKNYLILFFILLIFLFFIHPLFSWILGNLYTALLGLILFLFVYKTNQELKTLKAKIKKLEK